MSKEAFHHALHSHRHILFQGSIQDRRRGREGCRWQLQASLRRLFHLAAEKFDSDFWCGGEKRGDESRDEEQDCGTLHRRNRKAEGVLEAS